MDENIKKILEDLYMLDENLRKNEKELIEIIDQLLKAKPDTKYDEKFGQELRAEILVRVAKMKQPKAAMPSLLGSLFLPRKLSYAMAGVFLVILIVLPMAYYYDKENKLPFDPGVPFSGKTDDWKYDPAQGVQDSTFGLGFKNKSSGPMGFNSAQAPIRMNESIGLSAGGAKDINNFRENIKNNYLPLPTDITYEGLFYDYYFDTGEEEICDELFCPSYSYAISPDPFSKKDDYYLSVGLNSGIKESDFQRKKLNLVVVLDISGSMSSPFDRYYYDKFGTKQGSEGSTDDWQTSKIQVAVKSVVALLGHLNPDDRFGMVLFDDNAYLAKDLGRAGNTDMEKIKSHILEIKARGGTQMSAGMKMGTGLFSELKDTDQTEFENRIIFLTDAMPNIGETSEDGLLGMLKKNAATKIYTTFIGIGVDFNTELVDYITKIRGANYYSVHSSNEFAKRMDNEFEYMVTPLVFNLQMDLVANGYRIEKVYGSPEANETTGELMKVNTLFPSANENGETKGGIILLKLKKLSPDGDLKLKVSYEDRTGKTFANEAKVKILGDKEYYDNLGVRKGILLSRYADLVKDWIFDERRNSDQTTPFKPFVDREVGIMVPPIQPSLGQWERQSIPLKVSVPYKELFGEFREYFKREMNAVGDDNLDQEVTVLEKLGN